MPRLCREEGQAWDVPAEPQPPTPHRGKGRAQGRLGALAPTLGPGPTATLAARACTAGLGSRHPVLALQRDLAGLPPTVPSSCPEKATKRPPCRVGQAGGTGGCFPAFSLHLAQAGGRCGAEAVRGCRG